MISALKFSKGTLLEKRKKLGKTTKKDLIFHVHAKSGRRFLFL